MSLCEKIIEIENPIEFKWELVLSLLEKELLDIRQKSIIKLNLVKATKTKLYFNVVLIDSALVKKGLDVWDLNPGQINKNNKKPNISCLIIPTGVGARFGGFAGDANPLAKLFAMKADFLLTHPNVVNGAVLTDIPANSIYLEGYSLDQFLLGKISILPSIKNKIGIIFDKAITDERLEYELTVLNALKAFYGCEIIGWVKTDKSLNVRSCVNEYGFSSGNIDNLNNLIEKALYLKDCGATAIAVCTVIPDLDTNGYAQGIELDPIGGVESVISRSLSAATNLVCAHAPVLISLKQTDYKTISPVSAAEYIAQTFLPSVISGLRFAPQIISSKAENSLSFYNLNEIVLPYNAFGNPGVFFLNEVEEMKNRIFLVKENVSCLNINPLDLNLDFKIVNSYCDLIGEEIICKSGINPEVLQRPIGDIKCLESEKYLRA